MIKDEKRARGLAWIGCRPPEPEIPGSNPGGPATDLKFPIILFDLGENFNVKMHDLNF